MQNVNRSNNGNTFLCKQIQTEIQYIALQTNREGKSTPCQLMIFSQNVDSQPADIKQTEPVTTEQTLLLSSRLTKPQEREK